MTREIKPSDIEVLKRLFKHLPAVDAVTILCQIMDASQTVINLDARRFPLMDLYDSAYLMADALASDIEVRFYGGPPEKSRWFNGTLLTLLVDHCIFNIINGHTDKVFAAIRWMNNGVMA